MLTWIFIYAAMFLVFFGVVHHFDHTHVTSNYSISRCH